MNEIHKGAKLKAVANSSGDSNKLEFQREQTNKQGQYTMVKPVHVILTIQGKEAEVQTIFSKKEKKAMQKAAVTRRVLKMK